jgi:hypothetical protein
VKKLAKEQNGAAVLVAMRLTPEAFAALDSFVARESHSSRSSGARALIEQSITAFEQEEFRGDCAAENSTGVPLERDACTETMTMKKTSTNETMHAITTTIEHVTPEIAAEWLKKNVGNRPLNIAAVKRLARALTAGEYVLTHQGIAFDASGMLIDGQHRLHAVVESGVAIDLMVTRGVATQAREKIDTGKVRTVAHVLSFRFGLARKEAHAASALLHAIFTLNGQQRSGINPVELHAAFAQYRRGLAWAQRFYSGGKHVASVPTPILAALVWSYEHATKECEYIAEKFVKPTRLEEGSPIIALQSAARTNRAHTYEDRRALALKALRALECVLDKKQLTRIEAMPAVVDRLVDRFARGSK